MLKYNFVIIKLILSSLVVYYLYRLIDTKYLLAQFNTIKLYWIGIAIFLIAAQVYFSSLRWQFIAKILDVYLVLPTIIRIVFIGQLFNQLLPSSVGGDAMRIWITSKHHIATRKAVLITICDRSVGIIINIALPCICFLIFNKNLTFDISNTFMYLNATLISIILIILIAFISSKKISMLRKGSVLQKKLLDFSKEIYKLLTINKNSFPIIFISFLIQITNVFIVIFISKSLSIDINIMYAFVLIPTILLFSNIPLSFAGWGIRETSMVIGLNYININQTEAFAISVIYGMLQLIFAIPGIFYYSTYKSQVNRI